MINEEAECLAETLLALAVGAGLSGYASLMNLHAEKYSMTRFTRLAVMAASALCLTACLVPEKFEASVRFKADGAYVYKYEGSAVHFMAAAAIKQKGSLPAKDEEGLKREAEKAAKALGVQKMNYVGDGRYDIRIEEDVKSGQQVSTLKIFTITRDKEGAYLFAVPPMKDKDRDQLRSLGIKVDGTAEVFLPSNAKVLENNASGTPGLFAKSYSWKIGGVDDRPMIRFVLAQ
ncbi:MAG: hypothetical protein EOO81_00885 [Oxalobacteraceae bacterium]|nr:MAG: hypothetical protein EOO81_00885 [Oxalobacteraceae bacterium]